MNSTYKLETIRELERIRRLERISDADFAAKFGVHRTTWILIRNGKTKRPIDFLSVVPSVYPGLSKIAKADIEKILFKQLTNSSIDTRQTSQNQ
jgi:transcriptional regulator with XRE-family HTH domain